MFSMPVNKGCIHLICWIILIGFLITQAEKLWHFLFG